MLENKLIGNDTQLKKGIIIPYLVILTLIGFMLRYWGKDFSVPFFFMPDEPSPHITNSLEVLKTTNIRDFFLVNVGLYPRFFWYIVALFYKVCMVIGLPRGFPTQIPATNNWFQMMSFISSNSAYFLGIGRLVSVFFGSVTVPLLYYLGKLFKSEKTGLISASVLTFTFLHVKDSHYLYLDVTATFFVVCFFVFLCLFINKRSVVYFLLASVFSGVSIGIKYHLVFLLIPLFIAYIFVSVKNNRGVIRNLFNSLFWAGIVLLIFFIFLGNPLPFINLSQFLNEIRNQSATFSSGQMGFTGGFFYYLYRFKFTAVFEPLTYNSLIGDMGVIILVLSILGMFYSLIKTNILRVALVSFVIPFYLFNEMQAIKPVRFLIPIVPCFIIFMSVFLVEVSERFKLKKYILLILCVLILLPSAVRVVRFDNLISNRDTRVYAMEWIRDNIPLDEVITFHGYGWVNPPQVGHKKVVIDLPNYNTGKAVVLHRAPTLSSFLQNGVDYFIYNGYIRDIQTCPSSKMYYPDMARSYEEFYAELESRAPLVWEIKPNEVNVPGPEIRIYKLEGLGDK
jgi:hypothetical protein